MTPDSQRRRDKMLALMAEYVSLTDDLGDIESLAEFDRIMAEMNATKAQIDALIEEPARISQLC